MQDRTEPATPRKRDEARDEGKVAKSQDLNSAIVLIVGLIMLRVAGPYVMTGMSSLLRDTLANLHSHEVGPDTLSSLAVFYGSKFALICFPILAAVAAVGIATNVIQVGFRITSKSLKPDLSRLDPMKGMARLFSGRAMVEALKSTLKVTLVAYFVYMFLKKEYPVLIDLSGMPAAEMGGKIGILSWQLLARGCAVIFVIGVLDYMYQRISFEKSLRMTKQEVKDDYKRSEGDPQVKGKIRQRQREMARRRMIHDVARAHVVVTNPTRFAVALRYDSDEMAAPTVVAKGQRLIAQKIREVAEAHGIPIVENPPIARLIYKMVEVGQQIPEDLYQAVAEILAYVYQLSGKAGRQTAA
jgi:flagellar biosynthetic protein FlhB